VGRQRKRIAKPLGGHHPLTNKGASLHLPKVEAGASKTPTAHMRYLRHRCTVATNRLDDLRSAVLEDEPKAQSSPESLSMSATALPSSIAIEIFDL